MLAVSHFSREDSAASMAAWLRVTSGVAFQAARAMTAALISAWLATAWGRGIHCLESSSSPSALFVGFKMCGRECAGGRRSSVECVDRGIASHVREPPRPIFSLGLCGYIIIPSYMYISASHSGDSKLMRFSAAFWCLRRGPMIRVEGWGFTQRRERLHDTRA